jgi:hypothetical protein
MKKRKTLTLKLPSGEKITLREDLDLSKCGCGSGEFLTWRKKNFSIFIDTSNDDGEFECTVKSNRPEVYAVKCSKSAQTALTQAIKSMTSQIEFQRKRWTSLLGEVEINFTDNPASSVDPRWG